VTTAARATRLVPSRLAVGLWATGAVFWLLLPWWPGVLYWALGYDALLVTLALTEGLAVRRRAKFRLQRVAPRRFSLGEEHEVSLTLESFAPFGMRVEIHDEPPETFEQRGASQELRLAPFGQARVRYTVVPTRRGDHPFGTVFFRIVGPLGLAAVTGRQMLSTRARVYPSLKGLRRLELAARFLEKSSGFRSLRREGGGDEFEKLREYQPDDDYRHIDWKAAARRQRPVTRVFEAERNQTVMVCVDTGRGMAARVGDLTKLDHALNAALLLAYAAVRLEDQVGLLLFADEVQVFLPPRKGMAQFRRITNALYGAEATLSFVDLRSPLRLLRAKIRRRALMIFFTDLLDEAQARPLVEYARRLATRHLPLVVTLSDPAVVEASRAIPQAADEAYAQLVATEILREREALLRALRAEGAQVVDAPSDRISTAAVNRYIELKRARKI
jgi:uncharacterized protein (DUF58 family)